MAGHIGYWKAREVLVTWQAGRQAGSKVGREVMYIRGEVALRSVHVDEKEIYWWRCDRCSV